MSRRIFALLLVSFLSHGLTGCGRSGDDSAESAEAGEEDEEVGPSDRTSIEGEVAEESGIRTAPIGPGVIRDEREVQGILTPVEGRYARIVARFQGPVRRVTVGVGDTVSAGQVLAVIESNASLSDYTVTSPLAGTVLARNVTVGDLAGETPLFEIADLSRLWADLHLFGRDVERLAAGMPIGIVRLSDGASVDTVVDRILPGTAAASQTAIARATIENTDGRWRPGSAVRALITVSEQQAALIAPLTALQSMQGSDVVFVREGEEYYVRPVTLGERDARSVEILDGVAAGEEIVVEQSYLIKANIEKSTVEED
jgi:cobalt-zinc-cadmium efflux system membrane fusion protein